MVTSWALYFHKRQEAKEIAGNLREAMRIANLYEAKYLEAKKQPGASQCSQHEAAR